MFRQTRSRRARALLVVCCTTVGACAADESSVVIGGQRSDRPGTTSADTSADTAPDSSPPNSSASLEWERCGTLECATLDVPIDYADPDLGTIALAINRRAADGDRLGSLLVNPGGPGFPGTTVAEFADFYFSEALRERFDIIGFDPRGTGASEPAVDCIEEYDPVFGVDPSADDSGERDELIAAAQSFVDGCTANSNTDMLAHITTPEVARDMEQIRRALGETTISYFGFSYGSELGATWATMFPKSVRAAVLDGAADPNESAFDSSMSQLKGFEGTLSTFLEECAGDSGCAFDTGDDPHAAFLQLVADLDNAPAATSDSRVEANNAVLTVAVAMAMYDSQMWPELRQALGDAQAGDGDGLLALYDRYYQRSPDGTHDNSLEAFLAISCGEQSPRDTIEMVDESIGVFAEAAPLLGPEWGGAYICALWETPPVTPLTVTGAGAGPIVVVGTTGDAATPLASTERMAEALEDGRLIVVEANQHTGYQVNDCVTDAVDQYLIELEPPEDGLRCG